MVPNDVATVFSRLPQVTGEFIDGAVDMAGAGALWVKPATRRIALTRSTGLQNSGFSSAIASWVGILPA
ncbi:MAG: hypothetical protein WCF90_03325 [Methanomicrobiales archaeon]